MKNDEAVSVSRMQIIVSGGPESEDRKDSCESITSYCELKGLSLEHAPCDNFSSFFIEGRSLEVHRLGLIWRGRENVVVENAND